MDPMGYIFSFLFSDAMRFQSGPWKTTAGPHCHHFTHCHCPVDGGGGDQPASNHERFLEEIPPIPMGCWATFSRTSKKNRNSTCLPHRQPYHTSHFVLVGQRLPAASLGACGSWLQHGLYFQRSGRLKSWRFLAIKQKRFAPPKKLPQFIRIQLLIGTSWDFSMSHWHPLAIDWAFLFR